MQNKLLKITKKNSQSGFIALTSTLILTIALLVLMFASNTASFFARFDSLGSEFKKISLGLSESCSNVALLKVAEDYNYNYLTDPNYDEDYDGVVVNVGPNVCIIKSIKSYSDGVKCPTSSTNQKCLEIKTSAQYPLTNGSWSTNKIKVVVQNPSYSPTNPPPTCSFTASPTAIIEGQVVTLQWNVGGNATSISIKRNIGGTIEEFNVTPSDSPLVDMPTASATYVATVSGPSGQSQCESPQSVVVQPALSCADTVLMLDRTSHMNPTGSENYLADEREGANALLDVYDNVTPLPQVAIGVFGAVGSSNPYNANIKQSLTDVFSDLKSAITSGLSTASGGVNLSSAISIADLELNSERHIKDRKKALILVSNGEVTAPSGNPSQDEQSATSAATNAKKPHGTDNLPTEIFTIHFDGSSGHDLLASIATSSSNNNFTSGKTNLQPPTQYLADGGGDGWASPSGAQSNGDTYANDRDGDREIYHSFGFDFSSVAGAIPTGIEVRTEAWSTSSSLGCQIGISLSADAGVTWTSGPTSPTKVETLTGTESIYTFGGQNDIWGRPNWKISELNNQNFRVRVHSIDPNNSCVDESTTNLDYIQARIHYNGVDANKENSDKDNFFIANDSSDLSDIFETIGKLACPAGVILPPPPPPSPPPPPPSPPPIDIESWDEIIDILP